MLRIQARRPKPRRFSYEPRFYDPSKDDALRDGMRRRIRIERSNVRPTRRTRQPAFIAVGLLLVAVLYVYLHMDRVAEGAASMGRLFFGG